MVAYRAMLDVPRELVRYVAQLQAAHRRVIATRRGTQALSCYQQALFVLAWFRERRDVALTGRRFRISQATGYRYLDEGSSVPV